MHCFYSFLWKQCGRITFSVNNGIYNNKVLDLAPSPPPPPPPPPAPSETFLSTPGSVRGLQSHCIFFCNIRLQPDKKEGVALQAAKNVWDDNLSCIL